MSDFRVVNKTVKFQTRGEIDFIDLTDKAQEVALASGIKNGVVHVFAPHATGILIVEENDDALIQDTKSSNRCEAYIIMRHFCSHGDFYLFFVLFRERKGDFSSERSTLKGFNSPSKLFFRFSKPFLSQQTPPFLTIPQLDVFRYRETEPNAHFLQ